MAEYKTADANDFPEEFRKVEPIDVSVGLDPNSFALSDPRPDLNGSRIRHPAGAIYLILDGLRRHIPNPPTYNNLFRDWNGIITDINVLDITEGEALSDGAVLAVPNEGGQCIWFLTALRGPSLVRQQWTNIIFRGSE